MERVYLLLRQNTESGPFTLPELRQLKLQPTDLVWIEGASTSWSSATSLTEGADEPFRGPETHSWESPRTDAGPRATPDAPASAAFTINSPSVQGSRKSTSHMEEDIELILHKRGGTTVSLVQLLGVACITALLALAWDNRFQLLQTKDASISYASAPVVFTPRIPPAPQKSAAPAIVQDSSIALQPTAPEGVVSLVKVQRSKKSRNPPPTALLKSAQPNPTDTKADHQLANNEVVPADPPPMEEKVTTDIQDTGAQKTITEVKKKTFGQAIKNLFKKKGKRDNKAEAEEQ